MGILLRYFGPVVSTVIDGGLRQGRARRARSMPPNRLAEVDENVSSSSLLLAGKSLNERPDQSSFVDDSATLARALSTLIVECSL